MLKTLTIIYACLIGAIVVLANLQTLGPLVSLVHAFPFGDKACHFLLFGGLSFLLSTTLSAARPRRRVIVVVLTVLGLAMISSLEECSQTMFSHRQFDRLDMLSNIAGTLLFGCATLLIPLHPWQSGVRV